MDGNSFAKLFEEKEKEKTRKKEEEEKENLAVKALDDAATLLKDGAYEKAFEQANYSLELSNEVKNAKIAACVLSLRGEINFMLKNFAEAMEDQNRALTVNPKERIAYIRRAKLFLLVEQYSEAHNDIELAKELLKEPAEALKQGGFSGLFKGLALDATDIEEIGKLEREIKKHL